MFFILRLSFILSLSVIFYTVHAVPGKCKKLFSILTAEDALSSSAEEQTISSSASDMRRFKSMDKDTLSSSASDMRRFFKSMEDKEDTLSSSASDMRRFFKSMEDKEDTLSSSASDMRRFFKSMEDKEDTLSSSAEEQTIYKQFSF